MTAPDLKPGAGSREPGSRWWAVLIGVLTAAALVVTVKAQIYDTNFYSLWEAAALLAGDHPYRDFFEWGIPLQALVSAGVQWLVGYRLIGEFAMQWAFVIAGSVIAFMLGVRLSRSIAASMVTALVALPIVANTPTYHYPKLFFYPLAIWLAWRYLDAPGPRRAAALGLVTVVAFLFRHDHGVYLGIASILAFGLARTGAGAARPWRLAARDAAAYALAVSVLLVPWLVVLQRSEGIVEYVQTRFLLYRGDAATNPFRALLGIHPIRLIQSDLLKPGPQATDHAALWVQQMSLLVPLGLLVSACVRVVTHRVRRLPPPRDTAAVMLAAIFLVVIDFTIFREAGYAQLVAPLTAAMAASFLTRGASGVWWRVRWAAVAVLVLLTAIAGALTLRDNPVVKVAETFEDLPKMYSKLLVSPPIDAFVTPAEVQQLRRVDGSTLPLMVLVRYVHDCTRAGDRVLVSGSTPFDIGYLVERPIAGGHLYWHKAWRSDERHETQSLEMLRAQSVPFALGTSDPVLQELKAYPRIFDHFQTRYTPVYGSGGYLLVETGRRPTGRWALGLPCFK